MAHFGFALSSLINSSIPQWLCDSSCSAGFSFSVGRWIKTTKNISTVVILKNSIAWYKISGGVCTVQYMVTDFWRIMSAAIAGCMKSRHVIRLMLLAPPTRAQRWRLSHFIYLSILPKEYIAFTLKLDSEVSHQGGAETLDQPPSSISLSYTIDFFKGRIHYADSL